MSTSLLRTSQTCRARHNMHQLVRDDWLRVQSWAHHCRLTQSSHAGMQARSGAPSLSLPATPNPD